MGQLNPNYNDPAILNDIFSKLNISSDLSMGLDLNELQKSYMNIAAAAGADVNIGGAGGNYL